MIEKARSLGGADLIIKPVNADKLPKLLSKDVGAAVSAEYTAVNERQAAKDRKRVKLGIQEKMTQQAGASTASEERPKSARSGETQQTGGMTAAFTQFTGGQTQFTADSSQARAGADIAAITELMEAGQVALADLIRYDTQYAGA